MPSPLLPHVLLSPESWQGRARHTATTMRACARSSRLSELRQCLNSTSDDTVVVSRELGNEVAVFFDGKVIGPVAARAQLQDSLDDENEPVQVAALPSKCSASQPYDLYGFEWYFENYTWKYNNASAPVASAQSAFAAGASSMANGSSSTCGALQNGARSIYGGSTSTASSVSSGGGCTGTDNGNVIGWGAISSSKVLAYTCNYSFLSEVYEADMKFDTSGHLWSSAASGCASGRYDLQGVATHEFGHAFGLDHVASGTGQVMQASTTTCNYAQRQLGYGDQHGMYAMYGSTND